MLLLANPNVVVVVVVFYSCLLGCVTTVVWTYKLPLICPYSTFYPVQGMLEVNFSISSLKTAKYIFNWTAQSSHGTTMVCTLTGIHFRAQFLQIQDHHFVLLVHINKHPSLSFQNNILSQVLNQINTVLFVQMYGVISAKSHVLIFSDSII